MTDASVEIAAPVKLPRKNGIAKIETAPVPVAPVTESAALFGMIERLATQADVPVERIDKLFDLYQKVEADKARRSYEAAFAVMQPGLEPAQRRGTGNNEKKYARWEDMASVIMPALKEHGFGMSFRVQDAQGKVVVRCVLSHRDGHSEFNEFPFPYDKTGNKNDIQALASATTYGKRVTAGLMLGLATDDIDDDGKKASAGGMVTSEQVSELQKMIKDSGADLAWICEHFSVEGLADLTGKQFTQAKAGLTARLREKGAK